MPSFEELLNENALDGEKARTYLKTDELKETEQLQVVSTEMKTDSRGNTCAYIRYNVKGKDLILTQKYVPTQFEELGRLRNIIGVDELKKNYHPYNKRLVGSAKFARFFPKEP